MNTIKRCGMKKFRYVSTKPSADHASIEIEKVGEPEETFDTMMAYLKEEPLTCR